MDVGAARDIIRSQHRAVLATTRPDGEPQMSPGLVTVGRVRTTLGRNRGADAGGTPAGSADPQVSTLDLSLARPNGTIYAVSGRVRIGRRKP